MGKTVSNLQQSQAVIEKILAYAKKKGADQVEVSTQIDDGLSVKFRNGEVETVEHCQDQGYQISLYSKNRFGSASTSDVSDKALEDAVDAAYKIAQYTAEDDYAGIAEKSLLAQEQPDLDLDHPWNLTVDHAAKIAKECEEYAFSLDQRIEQSDGVSVNSHKSTVAYGNSHGFLGAYSLTRHGYSCVLIAKQKEVMQRNYSYTTSRVAENLASPKWVAEEAVQRTVNKLGAITPKTGKVPVVFSAEVASGLFGSLLSGLQGGSIYRNASFLKGCIGKDIMPKWLTITSDPFVKQGFGSAPFDAEGVAVSKMDLIKKGVLQTYLLDCYSARKLKMKSTGHAGTCHNILFNHSGINFDALLKQMGTGFLVTEVMGQGVNLLTGDYSRGASGFWVENGEIAYPVENATIAGNMHDMFASIASMSDDLELRGTIQTGSILIPEMMVAGSA